MKSANFEVEGIEVEGSHYAVTGTAYIEYDSDYGADADGNRGMPVWWVQEFEIESVAVIDEYSEEYQDINLKTISNELFEKLEKNVETYCDNNLDKLLDSLK